MRPIILPEIIEVQQEEVRRAFWAETESPKEHVHLFDKYAMLVSKEAEEKVQKFLSHPKPFQEIKDEAIYYQELADEIQYASCRVRSGT